VRFAPTGTNAGGGSAGALGGGAGGGAGIGTPTGAMPIMVRFGCATSALGGGAGASTGASGQVGGTALDGCAPSAGKSGCVGGTLLPTTMVETNPGCAETSCAPHRMHTGTPGAFAVPQRGQGAMGRTIALVSPGGFSSRARPPCLAASTLAKKRPLRYGPG
jgi:hypothetical protein